MIRTDGVGDVEHCPVTRTDGVEVYPGPPCPCEERVALLEVAIRDLQAEQERLRDLVRRATVDLARSWRATGATGRPEGSGRVYDRPWTPEGAREAPGAADGAWGSRTPGGGQ